MLISPTSIFITLLEVSAESEPNVHFLVDSDGESSYTHREIESSEEFPMAQNTAPNGNVAYDRVTSTPVAPASYESAPQPRTPAGWGCVLRPWGGRERRLMRL